MGKFITLCKKCNVTKREHDTLKEPIINPFVDNPKDYLFFNNYRYYSKNGSEIGYRTIEVLGLNDREHFVNPRFRIGNEMIERIQDFRENSSNLDDERKKNRFISRLKNFLEQGNRKEEYAALVSTIILSDENYIEIENLLISKRLWDEDFQNLKLELEFCALLKD